MNTLEKLKQQKDKIAAQILKAEQAEKNRAKVEKLVLKLMQKQPDIFLCDLKVLEKKLADSFSDLAGNLANRAE